MPKPFLKERMKNSSHKADFLFFKKNQAAFCSSISDSRLYSHSIPIHTYIKVTDLPQFDLINNSHNRHRTEHGEEIPSLSREGRWFR